MCDDKPAPTPAATDESEFFDRVGTEKPAPPEPPKTKSYEEVRAIVDRIRRERDAGR